MKHLITVALIALTLTACGKKEEEREVVPPGFCKAEAECQPTADRHNQTQEQLSAGFDGPRCSRTISAVREVQNDESTKRLLAGHA